MTTETKPNIHERMAAILAGLPAIGKDSFNQGLKFNFRSIDNILNELNPLLEKHGVFVLPEVIDLKMSSRPTKNGEATVAVVTVAYHFSADDGSEVVAVSVGEGQDSGDKAVSKAMTMAFKTCLGQTFAIATEEDPDGEDQTSAGQGLHAARAESRSEEAEARTGPPPPPAETQLAARRAAAFAAVKALSEPHLAGLKKAMAEEGLPMDFSVLTPEQLSWVENQIEPF